MINIVKTVDAVRKAVKDWKDKGYSVGLVPTMGYLHEGHQSLIKQAAVENDRVVVSIFVNPIQFGPNEDFKSYPRDLEQDKKSCQEAGGHLIFHPDVSEMYDDGFCSFIDMAGLTDELCGKSRPGHFRGVCTVVMKLFNIVQPHKAYFGQKDAQQLAVIQRMVRDFNMDIEIVGCPIVRENDGLAKSSRNTYLSEKERQAAPCLYQAILIGQELMQSGERDASVIEKAMTAHIKKEPLARIDYICIVDAESIRKIEKIKKPILCALAVYIGKTRLIDNFVFSE